MRTLVALVALIPSIAAADPHGFTGAVAATTGVTRLTANAVTPNTTEMGTGYTLTLGAFVRHDLAIASHVNVLFAVGDETLDGAGANVAFGAIAQYWPASWFSTFAGPGYSVAAYKRRDPMSIDQALGMDGGFTPLAGASFYPYGGWRASLEAAPLVTSHGLVAFTAGISLGWQYVRR